MSRILCVDDEPAILRLLEVVLAADGHQAIQAPTARAALAALAHGEVDAVLLDLGLPDRDGLELLAAIRAQGPLPVVILSAREAIAEKVAALDLGATDYVTKPFDADELRARLRAALRRASPAHQGTLSHGPITMDPSRHQAFRDGTPLALTPKEYALLQALVEAGGRILTHATLLERVWGKAHRDDVEYLRVAVRALRLKIEPDPASPTILRNEPGIGYRLA
jgi:two-component system KDP operon response regulator KdpE